MSARLKLTLSYAGFLLLAGTLLLAIVWLFLLRYVPDGAIQSVGPTVPNQSDLVRAFAPRAAMALLFLLLFGLGGGWVLAGRMLSPLRRITDATRLAAGGSLAHRIRLAGRSDEFGELADSFDAMLARLEAHDAEQQRFAANASHELRTPLAITQALLEVARRDPDVVPALLIERLLAVNGRAIDLTEALLVLSRADRGKVGRERVDLSLVVEEAAETLLPLAEGRGITIETAVEAEAVLGSQTLLLQLVTNLVHNAIVHNLAERGSVWVTSTRELDHAVLIVENTGDPIAPSLLPTLVEPFQRGAARTRADHEGVGLGLAIARSISQAHGGTLGLSSRPGGGLRVAVRLPCPEARERSRSSALESGRLVGDTGFEPVTPRM